jgi:beta-glucosidase
VIGKCTAAFVGSVVLATGLLAVGPDPSADARVPALGSSFEFGVAQSGFQSEGSSPDSNWKRWSDSGRFDDRIGNATDFKHRYAEDIGRAKALGVQVYRFSIEWARVERRRGIQDAAGWAFYDDVVREVVAAGMTPMITLNHWVHPGWAVDRGGWNRPQLADDLIAFGKRAIDRYASAKPIWITFNEPTEYVRRELWHGGLAPQNTALMADGIVRAHHTLYRYAHQRQPDAQVSSNLAFFPIPGVQQALVAAFPERMRDALDFVGVDHYYSLAPTDLSVVNAATDDFPASSQAPEAIYYVVRWIHERFPGKPIRIVENGLATRDNQVRPDGYRREDHLRDTIYWLQRAKQDGIPVVGYNYWSLTDNYEWGSYDNRFGLYEVDVRTDPALTRQPTAAVAAYRDITAHGGVPANYRPTRLPLPCSLVTVPDSCATPAVVR